MTTKGFFIKMIQRLEIGHTVGRQRTFVPYDNLEPDESLLWTTISEQYTYFLKQRRWRMRDQMTPARVEEMRARMRRVFSDLMIEDVERNEYDNLNITKQAYAAWQEAFNDLTSQYALA